MEKTVPKNKKYNFEEVTQNKLNNLRKVIVFLKSLEFMILFIPKKLSRSASLQFLRSKNDMIRQ